MAAVTRQQQILKQFVVFHRANVQVWRRLCYHARSLQNRGAKRYSTRTLISVIRFERDMESLDVSSGFKVNDHFSPYYARMWALAYPDEADLFEKRRLVSRDRPARYGPEPGPGDVQPDEPAPETDAVLTALVRELDREGAPR